MDQGQTGGEAGGSGLIHPDHVGVGSPAVDVLLRARAVPRDFLWIEAKLAQLIAKTKTRAVNVSLLPKKTHDGRVSHTGQLAELIATKTGKGQGFFTPPPVKTVGRDLEDAVSPCEVPCWFGGRQFWLGEPYPKDTPDAGCLGQTSPRAKVCFPADQYGNRNSAAQRTQT